MGMACIDVSGRLTLKDQRRDKPVQLIKFPGLQIDALPGFFQIGKIGLMRGECPVVEFLEGAA